MYRSFGYITTAILIILGGVLASCTSQQSQLEQILERGEIRVTTTYSPATYLIDMDSETGFEYELASLFAGYLKLKLKIVIANNKADMIEILKRGEADIAAGVIKTKFVNDPDLVPGPEYYSVNQKVVYKTGFGRPRTPADLYPFQLHVAEGSVLPETLVAMKEQYPTFNWKIHQDRSNYDLLDLIQNEEIAYAAVYSNELIMAQQINPDLRLAFTISELEPMSWITRNNGDSSLQDAIDDFFRDISENDRLAELIDFFYGAVKRFDYVDQRKFIERFHTRLPAYETLFRQAAEKYSLDWRFLAAMSYQESHWNERARSPTGVRGLMMLTLKTAKQVNVNNRLDPEQSIMGGARYIHQLVNAIPQRIQEPDRTWFALAAYNIGFGHLEDARILTQKRGGNPDKWQDVRETLPLLRQREWYRQTLFGFARGNEAVTYVENIRKYYSTLIQLTQESNDMEKEPGKIIDIQSLVL